MTGKVLQNELSLALAQWSEQEKKRRADRACTGKYQPTVNQVTDEDVRAASAQSHNFAPIERQMYVHQSARVPESAFQEVAPPSVVACTLRVAGAVAAIVAPWVVVVWLAWRLK